VPARFLKISVTLIERIELYLRDVMERKVEQDWWGHRPACGNQQDKQGSLNSPFPVSPSGGKPGRAGSPHAAGTLCASKQRWRTSMLRLPPQEGFQSATLKPPLRIPPIGTIGAVSGWSASIFGDRIGKK
jgi:hypothetical protein